jgi:type IV pilus assembly protein PilN
MIRINLLAEGKRPAAVRRTQAGAPPPSREWGVWVVVFLVLVGAAGAGAWWWSLSRQKQANAVEIRKDEEEVKKLEAIIKEVEEYKRKQAELEHKISVIKQLQANQRGPVQVMDQISRALPELLWLDRMTMIGTRITLAGRAFNSNAVANFMDNLDKVPQFQEPILSDMTQAGPVYNFTIALSFSYELPTPAAKKEPAAGVAPAPEGGVPGPAAADGTAGGSAAGG